MTSVFHINLLILFFVKLFLDNRARIKNRQFPCHCASCLMWNFRELQRLEFELEKEAELEAEKERLERELAEIKAQV